jgi:ATP-dependent exoDNAse (exonuclease V) alpha subunit
MLFKLHNARFALPKGSLLIVDEAGMIGNDDYQELLRVAATRKCHVILSGDERQLASIGRGGMFEVFADKYGSSTILDIKRQATDWGKQVAMALSKGEVSSGLSILSQQQRLTWQADSTKSMQGLLADWHKSSELVSDRLILAVNNKDVAALNHGVRQYLKLDGKLTGLELEVKGNHYMKGDRILICKTNKALGVVNGDLGEILEVAKDRFRVAMHNNGDASTQSNGKIVEFNPSEYSDFRHGYATTVFKAQGASIKDVYVFRVYGLAQQLRCLIEKYQ